MAVVKANVELVRLLFLPPIPVESQRIFFAGSLCLFVFKLMSCCEIFHKAMWIRTDGADVKN